MWVQRHRTLAATAIAARSRRQICLRDKLSTLIYHSPCSKISFCSAVTRIRSFHVNNKSVGYTWTNTHRLVHGLQLQLLAPKWKVIQVIFHLSSYTILMEHADCCGSYMHLSSFCTYIWLDAPQCVTDGNAAVEQATEANEDEVSDWHITFHFKMKMDAINGSTLVFVVRSNFSLAFNTYWPSRLFFNQHLRALLRIFWCYLILQYNW